MIATTKSTSHTSWTVAIGSSAAGMLDAGAYSDGTFIKDWITRSAR
jgi:hypothetical protein